MDNEKIQPMWMCLLTTIFLLVLICSVGAVLCPYGCKCENKILRANCSGAGIEVVPIQLNPGLHVMDLSHNKITLLYFMLAFYEKLQCLDVSRNRLKHIGSGAFKSQKLLTFLNLSRNYVDSLGKDAFQGLNQLTKLDLSYNQLKSIGPHAFKELNNLTILRMEGNQLDYFEDGTFKPIQHLQSLYIDDNSFMEIPSGLADLPQLKLLSLAGNLIEVIEDDKVPNLPELDTLVLAQNLIIEIQPRGFANLPKLDHLDISDNNLTLLPTTSLTKLSRLVHLKLSGNSFSFLPPVAFRGLFNLKYLMFTRIEPLEFIDARAFVDNINLERISMDYNYKIKTLPTRLFHGNPKLRYVSIRYNSIKSLVSTHFPLDQLNDLRVGGNPLDCNCSMGWLWNILHERKEETTSNMSYNRDIPNLKPLLKKTNDLKLDVNDIICEEPEELHNKNLFSASQRQMDCTIGWIAVISVSLTVLFILGIIAGVFIFMPKKKSETVTNREHRIIKTSYNAPPLPPPRKSVTNHEVNHVDRFIMPPILLQNRSMPMWESYSPQGNDNGNIYEQLNHHRNKSHVFYV